MVDDIAAQGAEPLFFLDYISIGKLEPEADRRASSRASPRAAAQAGCALLGGEMSEHPGVMEPGEFDLVGFAVGVVERDRGAARATCAPATSLVGFASPGCAATATRSRAARCSTAPAAGSTTPRGRARTTRSPTSCSARA